MNTEEFLQELNRLKKKGLLSEEAWLNIVAEHSLMDFERKLAKSVEKNGKQIRASNKK